MQLTRMTPLSHNAAEAAHVPQVIISSSLLLRSTAPALSRMLLCDAWSPHSNEAIVAGATCCCFWLLRAYLFPQIAKAIEDILYAATMEEGETSLAAAIAGEL